MKLLIVDDEKIAIEGIKSNVVFADYGITEVFEANSVQQAMKLLTENVMDIVICDIEMPNGSGLELMEWMDEKAFTAIKIILSCHDEFEFARQAVELNCQQYILKPATPEVLRNALEKATRRVEKQSEEQKIKKMGEEYVQRMAGDLMDEISSAEKVKQYIEEHLQDDLSVEELAQMVFISQNHLTRSFKKKYGKTVTEYIAWYRMNVAEELLRGTDITVTKISAKVGYPNYAYFSKLFKKHSGFTPSDYRNKYIGK